MQSEPRKASEVLLELENKLDTALGIIRIQDLNIKILSNKLNSILEFLEKQPAPAKITIEAANTDSKVEVPVSSEFTLPQEDSPKGFRRTSRPETFAGDNAYLSESFNKPKNSFKEESEVRVPPVQIKSSAKNINIIQNAIPVSQRVLNKDGKSLFLADVEIIDLGTMQSVSRTRTNGTGKWSASLGAGNYRIIVNKRESSTGGKLEATQEIQIDASESKLDLPAMIIRS